MAEIALHGATPPSIALRAHTLLCLQGFRGEGYSAEFVDNLAGIHRLLADNPDTWIEVTASPDAVCAACPHRASAGCTLNGAQSEDEMKAQDLVVLEKLGLQEGSRVQWRDIVGRIRRSISGDDLPSICGTCRWLPLGYCREGVNQLRSSRSSTIANSRRG